MKKRVKQLLSLVLVLALVLGTMPASALAEGRDACAFTTQPTGGTLEPGESLRITWETNFTRTKSVIVKKRMVDVLNGLYEYDIIATLGANTTGYTLTYDQFAALHLWDSIRVHAYYGGGADNYVESDAISCSLVPRAFTAQPTGGELEPDQSLTTSWATNFTRTKSEIVKKELVDIWANRYEYTVIDTVGAGVTSYTLTYNQFTALGWDSYIVRAYYGSGEGDYVDSESIPCTLAKREFTVQPAGTALEPGESLTLSFATNFIRTKSEIVKKEMVDVFNSRYEYEVIDTLGANTSTYTLTYDQFAALGLWDHYAVLAYYDDGNYTYVESKPISCTLTPREFTLQPEGGTIAPGGRLDISWNTNFVPTRVEIVIQDRVLGLGGISVEEETVVDTLSGDRKTYSLTYRKGASAPGRHFVVRAYYSDSGYRDSDPTEFTLNSDVAPVITTTTGLPDGKTGKQYSFELQADGSVPMTWSVDDYATGLPPGLTLSEDGVISGMPHENGAYIFRVSVTNPSGSDSCVLGIIVGDPPVIHPVNQVFYRGVTYSRSLSGYVTGEDVTWSIASGALPPGIGLYADNLIGAATTNGTYRVRLRASNYAGYDEEEFVITVRDAQVQISAEPGGVTFPDLEEGYGFGDVVAGTEVVFTNHGPQHVYGLSFAITGTNAGAFELVSIRGLSPSDVNGNVSIAAPGYGNTVPVRIRRAYGLAAGNYRASLVVKQGSTQVCSVPLSFTVTEAPDPPQPVQSFYVDQCGKTWTLHDYFDNGETAGGWSSVEDGGPLKVTVTNTSGQAITVSVAIVGSGGQYFDLYGSGEFHYFSYGNNASFTMNVPYNGSSEFYVWPSRVTQGVNATATLQLRTPTMPADLPLQVIGGEPYVYSVDVMPYNPVVSVFEGYAQADTQMRYLVLNNGTADLRNLKLEPWDMDDNSLYTVTGGSNTLAVGESTVYTVSMAEGKSAGTYGGRLRVSAYRLSDVTPHYRVNVKREVKPVTGRASIAGSGIHGQPLSVVLEGAPSDAEPVIHWIVPGSQGGTAELVQETYTPTDRNVGREIGCCVTFDGYEGELEAEPVEVVHDWYVVQTYREPTCTESGIVAWGCAVDGCSSSRIEYPEALGHSIANVPEHEATCESQGNQEYWTCLRCGECWLDAECTQTTTYEAVHTLIDPDNHVIDAVHFPDEVFRTLVAERFDDDGSGALSASERGAVTEMVCQEMNLASLVGIELFPNLEILMCGSNDLKVLDLSGNTRLVELSCEENDLDRIDVSMLPNLEILNVNGNAGISELILLGNPALEELSCQGTDLSGLALRGNPNLWYLDCGSCKITDLILTDNPALKELYCSQNELTDLDLSGNPGLYYVECFENGLTSLDVSGNPALKYLYCNDNALTGLTLGEQPALRELYCYHNSLTGLDLRGCPKILDMVLTEEPTVYEDWIYYTKTTEESGFCEFDVDPDVVLTTSTVYTPTAFDAHTDSVEFVDSLGRYFLVGNTRTVTWKDGIEPDFTALSSWSIGFFHQDSSNVTEEPVPGETY
ncbi:MAG: putative Ig domain-containing protein, partial [Lachnospiraceae bacterium]|nr:putative Ig domain-containing protein [Lachnospiraceae bacterium]